MLLAVWMRILLRVKLIRPDHLVQTHHNKLRQVASSFLSLYRALGLAPSRSLRESARQYLLGRYTSDYRERAPCQQTVLVCRSDAACPIEAFIQQMIADSVCNRWSDASAPFRLRGRVRNTQFGYQYTQIEYLPPARSMAVPQQHRSVSNLCARRPDSSSTWIARWGMRFSKMGSGYGNYGRSKQSTMRSPTDSLGDN